MLRTRVAVVVFALIAVLAALAPAPALASASGVVVSEFRFRGPAGASDEFVELVNAGPVAVDVSGWRVQACTATTGSASTRATIAEGTSLAPGQHLLVGHSAFSGVPTSDLTYAIGIADGGGVRVVTADGGFVDGVASVAAPTSECREGAGLVLPTTDSDVSFERIDGAQDTDLNSTDFAAATSDPHNRFSVPPALSISDVNVTEGGEALFTIALSAPSARPVTVQATTVDGSAVAPADYAAAGGLVTLAPGALTATFVVALAPDPLDEPDEMFAVELSGATRATIADRLADARILDDDAEPTLSLAGGTVVEGGEHQVAVTLSAPSGFTVSVAYATVDGTATAPSDYAASAGTLVFAPGDTVATIAVPTVFDAVDEPDETFTVTLANPVRVLLATAGADITIADDDEPAEEPRASTPGTVFVFGRLGPRGAVFAWAKYERGDAAPRGFVWYAEPGIRFSSTELTSLTLDANAVRRRRDDDEDDDDDTGGRSPRRAIVTGTATVGGESQRFELRVDGRTVALSWHGREVGAPLRGRVRIRAR